MKELDRFGLWLVEEEKSPLTVEKYLRDVGAFLNWLGERPLEKCAVLENMASLWTGAEYGP